MLWVQTPSGLVFCVLRQCTILVVSHHLNGNDCNWLYYNHFAVALPTYFTPLFLSDTLTLSGHLIEQNACDIINLTNQQIVLKGVKAAICTYNLLTIHPPGCHQLIVIYLFVISNRDEEIMRKSGADAVQYLQFQRYLIVLMVIIVVLSIGVILPVNFSGSQEMGADNFGRTTISNIPNE